jgi:hypothetical protein
MRQVVMKPLSDFVLSPVNLRYFGMYERCICFLLKE